MKINVVPSRVPGRYDPSAPNFKPRADWTGCRIRFRVPIESDSAREIAETRELLVKKYPGAILHLVPEYLAKAGAKPVALSGEGDEALLRDFVEKSVLPSGTTVDQVLDALAPLLPSIGRVGIAGVRFGKTVGTNVLSFEKVEVDFDRTGLTVVSGENLDWPGRSNGVGKSSYVSLPFLALMGRSFKDQKHDGWARQRSKAKALLVGEYFLADGKKLVVHRQRRPSLLRAWLDGKDVSMGDPTATQRAIERLTNTWDVLTNSVYVGQREIGAIFGTEKERKELFSRLLGFERFLLANEKLRKMATRRTRVLESALADLEATRASLREADQGREEIETALAECPVVRDSDVSAKKRETSDALAQVAELTRQEAALMEELDRNQKRFEKHLFAETDADARIDEYRSSLRKIEEDTKGPTCSSCGGDVDAKTLARHVGALKRKIEEQEKLSEDAVAKQNKNRSVRKALMEQLNAGRMKKEALARKVSGLNSEREKLEAQADARARLEGFLARKNERRSELRRAEKTQVEAVTACREEVAFADFCANAVGRDGLPAHLCAVVAPKLNDAASRYSDAFSGGEIGVRFAISDGDIAASVENLHGGEGVGDQSEGELRLAAIIAALSVRDALVPHNVLVLDEPSQGLDAANAEAFARGLASVVERFGHVIVISHNADLLSVLEPDHHVVVRKKDRVSTVQYS